MAKTKEISRRIKSITSTKKITRAMEMVAASKMRKATEAVLKTRTYANLSWETILNLSENISLQDKDAMHPLLKSRNEVKKVAVILITSNRGMCGGYNSAIINKVKESIKKHSETPVEFILLGKKGEAVYGQNYKVAAQFDKSDLAEDSSEAKPIIDLVIKDYLAEKYDKIFVAYTDFVSPIKQVPRMKQLLPIDVNVEDSYLGIVADPKISVDKKLVEEKEKKHLGDESGREYIFEPSAYEVLDELIPRLLLVQVYQAILEANASEHSARMSAMHQATEAATDMLKELKLYYNKARQAGITAEIAEISAGANALAD